MRNCFIPGCDQLCKGVAKRKMFAAPKDKKCLNAWLAVLPKIRTFKPHDKVCERHFDKDDIYTTYDNVINGLVYKIERGRPRLRADAVPCRNLNAIPTSRRPRNNSKKNEETTFQDIIPVQISKKKEEPENIIVEEQHLEVEEVNDIQEIVTSDCMIVTAPEDVSRDKEEHLESIEISEVHIQDRPFESLYDDIYEVILPNTLWGVHRCPERSGIFFSYIDPNSLRTTKIVTINCEGDVKVLLGNRLLNEHHLVVDINSSESLSELIAEVDEMKLCPKVFDSDLCEVTVYNDLKLCSSCAQNE